jgi:hypothetical protein
MADDERRGATPPTGFAGLSSMVSDVDDFISHLQRPTPASDARTMSTHSTQPSSVPPRDPGREAPRPQPVPEPQGGSYAGLWVLGALVAFIILMTISNAVPSNRSAQSATNAWSPASSSASPGTSLPATGTAPPATRLAEQKPTVGTNRVHGIDELRYCLAENIRLEGADPVVNTRIGAQVDRFNAMVDDYNSRCSSFRYYQDDLDRATAEVEAHRSVLLVEGRSRFQGASSGSPASSRPQPDPTVRAIQQQLNELGYDAGPADGFAGAKTRAAVSAFQRDQNLPADGIVSEHVLQIANATQRRSSTPTSIQLSGVERESLESACSTDKYVRGPAAYRDCVERQIAAMRSAPRRPDLSRLARAERESIESACSTDKYVNGPAAYNRCLSTQLQALERHGASRPNLSRLTTSERESMESACSTEKYVHGPAAYNSCLSNQLRALERHGPRPDLSGLTRAERESVESVCSTDRYVNGPASYHACLSRQLRQLILRRAGQKF